MIGRRYRSIPLDLFRAKCEIRYRLNKNFAYLWYSAKSVAIRAKFLIEQIKLSKARFGYGDPRNGLYWYSYEYWIEWDSADNKLVVASGREHCPLRYDSDLIPIHRVRK